MKSPRPKEKGIQLFCLQLETSSLQFSFFAYNCVSELFCLQLVGACFLKIVRLFTTEASLLTEIVTVGKHLTRLSPEDVFSTN